MAFQPKSYRKFMVASASAALVGSAVAPAASAATAAEDFSDVTEDHRHYDAINSLYEMGVFGGYGDGTFGVNDPIKRIDVATMLHSTLDLGTSDYELTFEDIPARVDEAEIAALVEAEVFDGYSEVEFGPQQNINRAEAAKVLVEGFGLLSKEEVEALEDSDFGDLKDTKLYPYVNAVADLGIASGYENGNFGVHDEIKRGDFAKMLHEAWLLWDEQNNQTVADVDGTVKDVLGINWVVDIPAANLDASADSTVELVVGEEKIELPYNEENDSFRNAEISTEFSEEELNNAEVLVDGGEAPEEDGEATELGMVSEIEGSKAKDVLGINRVVDLPVDSLEGASVDSTVWLDVNGEKVELSYNADSDSFRNAEISTDYSVADLNEATVLVK